MEKAQTMVVKAASTVEHFRMDVDQDNGKGSTTTESPQPKKVRATRSSRATGSTPQSRDNLAEAKNTRLPDSDEEGRGKKA